MQGLQAVEVLVCRDDCVKKQDGSAGVPIKGACLDMSKMGYTRVSEEKSTRKERR